MREEIRLNKCNARWIRDESDRAIVAGVCIETIEKDGQYSHKIREVEVPFSDLPKLIEALASAYHLWLSNVGKDINLDGSPIRR